MIVFSRAPVPGRVKTRLATRLGARRAAHLHMQFTEKALATAREAGCGPVELHLSARHSRCRRARLQRGKDLGERMYLALSQALKRHRAVILIGSDCPALSAADVRRAARWLAGGCDVVLAPTEDGGYALIAARRLRKNLFAGIEWGTASVYGETVRRLDAAQMRWRSLGLLWDVDRPEDLERLRSLRLPSGRRLPAPR